MKNLTKKILCALSCATLGLTMGMSASYAAPPPPAKHAAPHHGAPAPHRGSPAPHHPGPRGPVHHHHHSSEWVAPLVFGAIVAGATVSAINSSNQASSYTTQQAAASNSSTTIRNNTLFWCEAEKGYYPDVRACPTGWTPVPSTK